MRVVFVDDRTALMPRLNMLERSTTTGQGVAALVLSLVLHRSNSGAGNDNIARRWLRKVEGDEAGPEANVTWKNECLHQNLGRRTRELEASRIVSLRNRLDVNRYQLI